MIRHPPGMQPQVLFQGVETVAGVELDIPKTNAQFPGIKGGGGAEIIRVKSSIHQGKLFHTIFHLHIATFAKDFNYYYSFSILTFYFEIGIVFR